MPQTAGGGALVGVYQSTPPVVGAGQAGSLQEDVSGDLKVVLATLISGEDQTNNALQTVAARLVVATYSPLLYTNFGAATNAQVKATPTLLTSVEVDSVEQNTLFYLQLFNATSATGTPLYSWPLALANATSPLYFERGADIFGPNGKYFSTALSWGISSTKSTYTSAGTAANYQVHIHYF
jgi:hypothetical protein